MTCEIHGVATCVHCSQYPVSVNAAPVTDGVTRYRAHLIGHLNSLNGVLVVLASAHDITVSRLRAERDAWQSTADHHYKEAFELRATLKRWTVHSLWCDASKIQTDPTAPDIAIDTRAPCTCGLREALAALAGSGREAEIREAMKLHAPSPEAVATVTQLLKTTENVDVATTEGNTNGR